jgi:hypothetical protein
MGGWPTTSEKRFDGFDRDEATSWGITRGVSSWARSEWKLHGSVASTG